MLEIVDIPRFNFIEPVHGKNAEHFYFVTTDVNEAVEHYLHKIKENDSIYMTISSIDGNVCVAKSFGLNKDKTGPNIIRIQDEGANNRGRQLRAYTKEFIKTVKKRIEEN